jgi:integrase
LLAATGLRISEAVALRVGDLTLSGNRPVVRVRRAWVRGAFKPPNNPSANLASSGGVARSGVATKHAPLIRGFRLIGP